MERNTFKKACRRGYLLIGIVLLFFIVTSCLNIFNRQEGEIYYIPNGLTGDIRILFECEDGLPKEWKDGKRLYRVPPSGILKTQFETNDGWLSFRNTKTDKEKFEEEMRVYNKTFEFYYVDENYNPIRRLNYAIDYVLYENNIKQNDYNVYGKSGILGFGGYDLDFTSSDKIIKFGNMTSEEEKEEMHQDNKFWYRVLNWDTFDVRKDSVPEDFDWVKMNMEKRGVYK